MERAYKQKDGGLPEIVGDPLMSNIVNDPRYEAFIKKNETAAVRSKVK